MAKGKNPLHLQYRDGGWWFRKRVSQDVRSQFPSPQFLSNLRTRDRAEAIRLADLKRVEVGRLEDQARLRMRREGAGHENASIRMPSEEEALQMVDEWLGNAIRYYEDTPLEDFEERDRIGRYVFYSATQRHGHADVIRFTNFLLTSKGYDDWTRFEVVGGKVKFRRSIQTSAPIRRLMHRYAHAAITEAKERYLQRIDPGHSRQLNPAFVHADQKQLARAAKKLTLSDLIKLYRATNRDVSHSLKTKIKQRAQDNIFEEIIGKDTLVTSLGREQARRLRDVFSKLPPNQNKKFPGLTIDQILALPAEKLGRPMRAITANSYLSAYYAMIDFAVQEELLEKATVRLKSLKDASPTDPRRSFKEEELKKIFSAPLYTGCVDDEHNYAKAGPNKPRRHRFWLPLLLMFSGARANEICQLTCDDIQLVDGVFVYNLRFDPVRGKRLKNAQSTRLVPIHSKVVEIGFLDYVEGIRTSHGELAFVFPELPIGSTTYRSDPFSKWFGRYMNSVGLPDPQIALHSFRHTLRDALREGGVPAERASAIAGWSSGGMAAYYGDGFKPSTLAKDLEKAVFGDVGLDMLVAKHC